MPRGKHDWTKLDLLIDQLKGQGWNDTQIAKDLGLGRQTLVDHLRSRELVHHGTLGRSGVPQEHLDLPEPAHQSTPERTIPAEAHPRTPEVHQNMSEGDSSTGHSGVPARQVISTLMVHPGTPTEEDWELRATMKGRWTEIEKMLADWQLRRRLLSTPSGTPRHTVKKTYVVDQSGSQHPLQ